MAGDSGGQPPPRGEVLQGADRQAGRHAAPHILQGIETRARYEPSKSPIPYDICVGQEELREHVTNVSCTSVATGILGLMGNKGGVGISLRSGHDRN